MLYQRPRPGRRVTTVALRSPEFRVLDLELVHQPSRNAWSGLHDEIEQYRNDPVAAAALSPACFAVLPQEQLQDQIEQHSCLPRAGTAQHDQAPGRYRGEQLIYRRHLCGTDGHVPGAAHSFCHGTASVTASATFLVAASALHCAAMARASRSATSARAAGGWQRISFQSALPEPAIRRQRNTPTMFP